MTLAKLTGWMGGVAAVAFATGFSPPAMAEVITTSTPSTFSFESTGTCNNTTGCNGGTPSQTLSATAIFSNFQFSNSGSTLTFTLTLSNTTPVNATTLGESLTAFAFNTN